MDTIVTLKKYSNRRLYDTEASKYVTLDDVGDMIKAGRRVSILDAKTSEDVTAFILTQILLEETKKKNILLPVSVLHQIIQFGDNVLGEFFEKYLQRAIQNYLDYKQAFDKQMKQWLDMGMDMSKMVPKTGPLAGMMDFFSSATPGQPPGNTEDGNDDPEKTE
jgi:polyhydroxyalkanoate synthesis repressor PhaR